MNGVPPHHIRVKRHKQTIFLHCDLQIDTVLAVKERISKLTGRAEKDQRLLLGKQVLENHTTLYDCGIEKEDGEMSLVYSIGEDPTTAKQIWEELEDAMNGAPLAVEVPK